MTFKGKCGIFILQCNSCIKAKPPSESITSYSLLSVRRDYTLGTSNAVKHQKGDLKMV